MARRLRSGYTTGACAAAAAKAAALLLRDGLAPEVVEIPFPDGSRHGFSIFQVRYRENCARASVIKDAGDDPDVTNGAEVGVIVRCLDGIQTQSAEGITVENIRLCAGEGVGHATKPGLAVRVGEPAINPVPRQMIREAVREALGDRPLQVEVFVSNGEELARKTLNRRLGIIGGLSILGTTGIVRPVSADAWMATIKASMNVALETGLSEIVLSTGRTSERGIQSVLKLPEEAYAMMGDYLEFSLREAARKGFKKIYLSGMWAKITKAALKVPQTHVRNGVLAMNDAAALMAELGVEGELLHRIEKSNTAREMYVHLRSAGRRDVIRGVCEKAREYGMEVAGRDVEVYLVNHRGEVVEYV